MTIKEYQIKVLKEKLEQYTNKKVHLQENNDYAQFLLDKKKKAAESKKLAIQNALANGAVPIEKLKKGAIFNFPGKDREYYFDGYNRSTGKYSFHRADDINHFGEKGKGTLVMIESIKKEKNILTENVDTKFSIELKELFKKHHSNSTKKFINNYNALINFINTIKPVAEKMLSGKRRGIYANKDNRNKLEQAEINSVLK